MSPYFRSKPDRETLKLTTQQPFSSQEDGRLSRRTAVEDRCFGSWDRRQGCCEVPSVSHTQYPLVIQDSLSHPPITKLPLWRDVGVRILELLHSGDRSLLFKKPGLLALVGFGLQGFFRSSGARTEFKAPWHRPRQAPGLKLGFRSPCRMRRRAARGRQHMLTWSLARERGTYREKSVERDRGVEKSIRKGETGREINRQRDRQTSRRIEERGSEDGPRQLAQFADWLDGPMDGYPLTHRHQQMQKYRPSALNHENCFSLAIFREFQACRS